jgi:CBS domain containing-hemolysin-like protein
VDLPLWEVTGILVSLGFSALFSASETALTSLSEIKVQQILDSRRLWGKPLILWQKHPHRVLATILIGNNIVNITASALATELTIGIFPDSGVPIAIGAMTFLILITGEITPKAIARTFPTALALPTMAVIYLFYVLFFPVTWVLTVLIRGMILLLGGRPDEATRVTEQDLEYIVRLGATAGAIDKQQESLFQSVIEFPDTIAKEIMVPRTELVAIPLDSTYEQVVEIAIESGFSRIPVYDASIDKIVGIFYSKNLLDRPQADEKTAFLKRRMRPPVFVPESKKISELLRLFQGKGIHMAIVVNEFGGTEGIVTLEDVIEELLGDIRDEFDVEEERLVAMPEGGYHADARIEIEEVEEKLGIAFPEERDYESLGGFLMEAAGTVPNVGWTHEFAGFDFVVTKADANRVIAVEIRKTPPPSDEAGTPEDPAEDRSS